MIRRTAFLVAFSLLLLVAGGCDSGSEDDGAPFERGDTSVLVPLDLGNTWTYRTGPDETVTATVEGTASRDGATYYLAGPDLGALRNDDDGLYGAEYDVDAGGDVDPPQLFFQYPVENGESYTFAGREITVQRRSVTVPAGTFEDAYAYTYEDFGEPLTTTIVPGVGIVRIESNGGPIELVSNDLVE